MTNKGERSHFSGMSGEAPGDGCPSGRLSKERTKGSPWARTVKLLTTLELSRENTCKGHCSRGQKAGISSEDEKTKGHSTP